MFRFEVLNESDEHVRFRFMAGKDYGSIEERGILCLRKEEFEQLNASISGQELMADIFTDIDLCINDDQIKNLLKAKISGTIFYHKIKKNMIEQSMWSVKEYD